MVNGNVHEFLDLLSIGQELEFTFCGKSYFIEGWYEDDGRAKMMMFRTDIPFTDYDWFVYGDSMDECYKAFLAAPVFDGQAFWSVEKKIEWTSS